MSGHLSRSSLAILATSSALYLTFRFMQWRARKRARDTVDRVKELVKEGEPLFDYENENLRNEVLLKATRRASKWMSLSKEAKPMIGQVGGVSVHKKPLLTMEPDYVLKPLLTDQRGIREIAFYEAVRMVSQNPSTSNYTSFLKGSEQKTDTVSRCGEIFDTVALALNIFIQDPSVMESEAALKEAWKAVKREVDALHNVAKFMAPYYGLVWLNPTSHSIQGISTMRIRGPPEPQNAPYGVTDEAHLLLQDLTINFSKPCVMDLKLGTQSYEPDATEEKRIREFNKYPEQALFGFRIVGMRIYDPAHPQADSEGFRYFPKSYGRSLKTENDIRQALRIFFSAGVAASENDANTETIRRKAISDLLVQMRPLRRWFDDNRALRFYASSLLICYEGDTSKDSSSRDIATIKMIDFGRVRRESAGDSGYSFGLRKLKNLIVDIIENDEERLRTTS